MPPHPGTEGAETIYSKGRHHDPYFRGLKVSFQINDLREQPPGLLAALVVDDDRSLRPIFCGMLEHLGFDTVCAADATQALSLLESGTRCDLLLTEVQIPGDMDGGTLANAVRDTYPSVMVIIVTAFGEPALSLVPPDIPILHKPFRMAALRAQIDKWRKAGGR